VTAVTLAVERPTTQAVKGVSGALGAMGREQSGSSAVYEERS